MSAPVDIAATGWPAVERLCERKLGLEFDDWQAGAGRLILAKRADGSLACQVDGVGMSLPRQVGKTYLLAALIFALCILRPKTLVIWSAHHGKTHGETFLAMQAFAERVRIAPFIDRVYTGSGDEEVRFHNGSRILFGAREHGFGRGIAGVDILVFDEAQILSDKALANMLATLNTSAFGLALFIGTPPRPVDNSEVFTRMRTQAKKGDLRDGAWIEFGLAKGADPADRKQWPKVNPSHPKRTPLASMLRLQRKLTPEDWLREGLGRWDDDEPGIMPGWGDLGDDELRGAGRPDSLWIGLAGDPEGRWGSIAAAHLADDGSLVVGAVERREGQAWLVGEAKRIQAEHGYPVVLDGKGPLSDLIDDLDAEGVVYTALTTQEYVDACQAFWRAVDEGRLAHPNHRQLDLAVRRATWRRVGDRRAFGRRSGDISMLEAATVAAAGAEGGYDVLDSVL